MPTTEDSLTRFVRESLARGISRGEIEKALANAGWEREQIHTALAGFAEVDFPLPVPRPRPYLSAREAFFYLVLFATLFTSAYSLGTLCFEFIEWAFPDAAAHSDFTYRELRWSIARLVVAFPVFLFVAHRIHRNLLADPGGRASLTRKWLTYIALFFAATILIGDIVVLVYNVLAGELTLRFLLKVLVVLLIAGTIFAYYLWDLRRDVPEASTP